jgi:hypothetical protein
MEKKSALKQPFVVWRQMPAVRKIAFVIAFILAASLPLLIVIHFTVIRTHF